MLLETNNILGKKGVCAIGGEISMYKMAMFARHFTEYLHALKDWDVHHAVAFPVAAS